MALDRDRVRFKGKAISAAIRSGGSIEGDDAAAFFDELHREWVASGEPLDAASAWLEDRLCRAFAYLTEPPVWVEGDPSWPYLEGRPMVFLTQCSIEESELAMRELSPGETVYLFGGRITDGGKTRVIYRTISQFAKGF